MNFYILNLQKSFVQNGVPIKNNVLPGIRSKRSGKGFLVEIKNKILL